MEEGLNVFSIKDLENFSGIRAHTIRIWEKRYNILEPDRTDSNIRRYNESELKKILNVAFLNRNGLKISKIAKLDEDQLSQQVMSLSSIHDDAEKDFHPGKILMSAIRFNEEQFCNAISPFITQYGIEDAYCRFLHPLQEKARILWQTGSLSKAQEQFIMNTIRQLITVEDYHIKPHKNGSAPSVAMINTSESFNGNNFLFYKYVLKKRGYDVIFTGGILPSSDIAEIYNIKPFEYLVVNSDEFDFRKKKIGFLNTVIKSLSIRKVILADFPDENEKKFQDKFIITRDPGGFIRCVEGLR